MLNLPELVFKMTPFKIDSLEDIGDILQYALPWAALLAVALTGSRSGAYAWLYSGAAVALLVAVLKFAFNFTALGRRPNGGSMAFPSGHTASAFMGAAYFGFYFGPVPAIVPYLLAGLTGYSRVYAQKHWWRDVFAGALLSIIIVWWFVGRA